MLKYRTVFGVDGAVRMNKLSIFHLRVFGKTEVGAGTEVAVELLHIMALGICRVKFAEVGLVLHHVLKAEILYDLLLRETFDRKPIGKETVLLSMCLKPRWVKS